MNVRRRASTVEYLRLVGPECLMIPMDSSLVGGTPLYRILLGPKKDSIEKKMNCDAFCTFFAGGMTVSEGEAPINQTLYFGR